MVVADTLTTISHMTSVGYVCPSSNKKAYDESNSDYWSTACSDLRPSCILLPRNSYEVSTIVNILRRNGENFAIKSGGHNANPMYSSIHGGPLISMRRMNEVILNLDADKPTVRVGPGNRWEDVSRVLDGTGYACVGGRIGNVGVGGFLPLDGAISVLYANCLVGGHGFLSPQYGWAANSVLEMDVVLADGSIVTASETLNSDLWKVLRGGGNRFGIVTSYLIEAHPISPLIYGGIIMYNTDKQAMLLKAFNNFVLDHDPKADVLLTRVEVAKGTRQFIVAHVFYDGPDSGRVFDEFMAAGPIRNGAKVRTFHDYLTANNIGVIHGSVYTTATETSPWPTNNGEQILGEYLQTCQSAADKAFANGLLETVSMAFQAAPGHQLAVAKEKGGDLMDMDPSKTYFMVDYTISYRLEDPDADAAKAHAEKVDASMVEVAASLKSQMDDFMRTGRIPKVDNCPLLANHAYYKQDVWARLKPEQAAFARSVRDRVDPDGFFSKKTGGWSL